MFAGRKTLAISIVLAGSLLLSSVGLAAQQNAPSMGDWSVLKALTSGSKLVVRLKTGRSVEGKLSSVSDTSISLSVKGATADLKRDDVQSVYHLTKKSSTNATLIGLGVGAAAGAAIGVAGGGSDNGFEKIDHAVTAGLTVVGAAAGALTGYLLGKSGSKRVLIYEAK